MPMGLVNQCIIKHGNKICRFMSDVIRKPAAEPEKIWRVPVSATAPGTHFGSGSGQNAPGSAPVRFPGLKLGTLLVRRK